MGLIQPNQHEAVASLRAIKSVVSTLGPMKDVQRNALELAQRYFLHTSVDLEALPPIDEVELAAAVQSPALRRQLVQVMCAYVMLGAEVREEYLEAIRRYARALEIDEPTVHQLHLLMEERIRWLVFDFRRRNAVGDVLKRAYRTDGIMGVVRTILQVTGHVEDAAIAARFDALEKLPAGTLGHELWRFYRDHGYTLPGHPGGTGLPLVAHDLMHILAGYETDIAGEIRTLAFQTGLKRDNPLMFLFLLLFQVQLGVEMVALVKGVGSMTHYFDDPAVLEEAWKAYGRGVALNTDLMNGEWDYWAVIAEPVEALRARYGVPPQ